MELRPLPSHRLYRQVAPMELRALQFYFLRNDEVEVRQAQLQTVDDSMVEVLVEQKTTKHIETRVLSAYQLVTLGQYPFAKRLRV
jgi:hypothetical protein